jgi:hypothetical protein
VLVLFVALFFFVLAMLVSESLIQPAPGDSLLYSIMVSVAGYFVYWSVLAATGFRRRFMPTVSCIMACGSILTILMVASFVVLVWSVPVKGHIIARAIERHWYVGIAISLAIFVMQRVAYDAITANIGS